MKVNLSKTETLIFPSQVYFFIFPFWDTNIHLVTSLVDPWFFHYLFINLILLRLHTKNSTHSKYLLLSFFCFFQDLATFLFHYFNNLLTCPSALVTQLQQVHLSQGLIKSFTKYKSRHVWTDHCLKRINGYIYTLEWNPKSSVHHIRIFIILPLIII